MQMRFMQLLYLADYLTKKMLLLGLGDQLAVLTSFDELQCNGSKKKLAKDCGL
jgi:hypothetical protein